MMLEKAIKLLKQYQGYEPMFPDGETLKHAFDLTDETVDTLLAALRPVSREMVEKVWRGEWNQDEHGRVVCNRCGSIAAIGTENALHNAKKYDRFCFYCGAPMTDEAVEMVVERLEALHENT